MEKLRMCYGCVLLGLLCVTEGTLARLGLQLIARFVELIGKGSTTVGWRRQLSCYNIRRNERYFKSSRRFSHQLPTSSFSENLSPSDSRKRRIAIFNFCITVSISAVVGRLSGLAFAFNSILRPCMQHRSNSIWSRTPILFDF